VLFHKIKGRLDQANKQLTKFTKDFATCPVHALEWADKVFEQACFVQVATDVMASTRGIDEIESYVRKQVTDQSRWIGASCSTSPCSNIVRLCQLKAWADILDMIAYS